jgi:membrane-associated phospholipid phosphatase
MLSLSRIRIARDYNRTLALPVRWGHVLWAVLATAVGGCWGWATHPGRRQYAVPSLMVIAAVAFVPLDPSISRWFEAHRPTGDVRRELEALQQFGQLAVSVCLALAVVLLDRRRARRLLDWGAGAVVALVTVHLLNGMTGRPRPSLGDPWHLTGPAGLYPVPSGSGYRMDSPWTSGYDLASLPSRHACFAVLAAVFLSVMYPRVRPLAAGLALVVMVARVVLGAQYASDVLVGGALGYMIGHAACGGWWGVGLLDRLWRRWVDPFADPALPRMQAAEAARSGRAERPDRG